MGSTVSRNLRHRPVGVLPHPIAASAMAVAMAFVAVTPAWSNPQGGVAIVGSATMANNGNQLVVTTQNGAGQNYSAINWQSFSIPSGSSTYFQQPSASSTVINRVVTSTPSLIYGTLGSNGNLVLVNQSGITVGAGAVVDTAGFTASALRMSDADALAGRMRFGEGDSQTGAVSVQGQILARSSDVVLLGASVDTGSNALIQAPNGNVLLAAGQQVDITGRGLEGIVLRVQAPTDTVVNLGKLQGDAVGMFASSLHHSGDIQANAVTVEGGKVVLKATQAAQVDGSITAKALNDKGGSVMVTADQVALGATAVVDVSGANGGGEALIGGGFQGKDTRISNARTTSVAAGARILADATASGNGGDIVVWSDDATTVRGSLSAQGAGSSGNGGNLETSGHHLDVEGITVSAKASGTGKAGDWLLDPYDITISANGTDSVVGGVFDAIGVSQLSLGTITSALNNGTNVTVTTGSGGSSYAGNITVADAISYVGSAGQNPTLTLNATNDIIFYNGVYASGGKLNLAMTAGNNIQVGTGAISLNTNGGSIQMTAGGSVIGYGGSVLNTKGGNVAIYAAGDILNYDFYNSNGNIAGTNWDINTSTDLGYGGTVSAAGNISLGAAGSIRMGNLTANGGYIQGSSGNGGNGGAISIAAAGCSECYGSTIANMSTTGGSGGYSSGTAGTGGSVTVVSGQGILVGPITTDVLNFATTNGGISLNSGTIKAMNLSAAGAISINTTGLTQFSAVTTGPGGSVSLYNNSTSNIGALEVVGITALNGNVVVENYGALSTTGAVKADGTVSLTAHSPITIGTGGISAGGNVTLAATTASTNSNITLNGNVQSAASVNFSAYNNIVQNSFVQGYGVAASSTSGTITFGPNGYTAGSPVSYTDIHGAVTVPLLPASSLATQVFDPNTVLDLLVASNDSAVGSVFTDNPFAPENRKKSDLVMEGQLCTP